MKFGGVGRSLHWVRQCRGVTLRVFLVDDHEVVRRGLHDLLQMEDDLEVVGEAGSVQQAIDRLPSCRPDVAVLDVRLPDGSGVELCRAIRSSHPDVACLMLTSYPDDEAMFDAVLGGAVGYLLKQVRGADIVAAVRDVGAGKTLLDPAMVERVSARLRAGPEEDPRLRDLTPRERTILGCLADGWTNRHIAEELGVAEKTVKNHVTNLLSKLGMSRRTEAAVYAVRMERDGADLKAGEHRPGRREVGTNGPA